MAKGGRTQPDRIVAAERIGRELGWIPRYPDVFAGMQALLA
jgi:hypothetical protein